MKKWWIRRVGTPIAMSVGLALIVSSVVLLPSVSDAQEDRYETCAAYGTIVGTGGQTAADAAARLQALGAPNPFGVDNVLEVIINAESDVPPIGSRPTATAIEDAYVALNGYFGDVCAAIDICPLIRQAVATNDGSSATAARLARGITAPAPPGIDAALALISGAVAESPFHASVAEAQQQIAEYFPCGSIDVPPSPGAASDVAETCADLGVLGIPEGPRAVEAAERLRAGGAPNPPGIESALDTLVAAADFAIASPPLGQIDAALAILDGYFGGACAGIDRCAFVAQIAGQDAAASAEAARLLRRIETPSPPGIDAALALVAGEIDESPFHATVGEARRQIIDYYPCAVGGTDGNGSDGSGLAFTGSSMTAQLTALGVALVATGAASLFARRRLDGRP